MSDLKISRTSLDQASARDTPISGRIFRDAREEHLHCVKISVASLDISVPLAIDGDFPGTLQLVSGDLWSPDVAVIKTRLNNKQ